MDDDELIAAVAAGDDAALRDLFSRHASWLAVRLRRVLAADGVEDVLQETFLSVWRGAGAYRPEGMAGGWLWGIAHRQAALWARRQGPRSYESAPWMERAVPDPQETVLDRIELDDAVASLGPEGGPERELWRLLYLEDRQVAEVAQLMGVPEGTVKSRAHRVRRLLRKALLGRPVAKGGSS